ncbi:efflux RND transporter periplasmic adaptor subunit [Pseudomonas sp. B21-048]|uniref:efflux RND transporter periplasmic adaptor subunit n=1 Tax=Pseudomonas sp. B21-048 TaxID=2895490 RepID=UPI00215FD04B|nr:efflux RND transporter periplasmic adaptor subunit [Pseudomonas sp. B21-048]UVK96709.1 efflux RND transporter periplasmic adaptor subunit [Pseudomonas sp. B21-048]
MNPNLAFAGAPRSHRLWLGAGVCLLLVSLGILLLWPSDEPAASVVPPLRVSTATAGPAMLDRSVQVNGALVAREEIAISSSVPEQRVAKVNVEEGDSVQAQQLLARLETQGLDAQVRQAQAVWARARAAVGQQEAVTVEAQATFKRIESLGESGAVSEQQVDERRAQADSAAANLRAARAEVEQALAQLADARHHRSKADIRAPFAGVIVERMARTGALSGGEPMFRLIREGVIEFEGEVAETDLVDITPGQTLRVQIAGISSPMKGTIRRVVPKVDARSRLGRVRIELGYSPLLRVGTYAQATLVLAPRKLDVTLPARAFSIIDSHRAWVMRINDQGLITRQTVATGRRSGDLLEITSGLQAGERVVANASAFVREGDVVNGSAAPAPLIEEAP